MSVTLSKRSQVVALRQHRGLSIKQIADQLGLAKSTVGRIVKAEDENDDFSIHRRGRCGRKRKTTSHGDKTVIRNSIKSPWKTSKELQSDLATSGVLVDCSIIAEGSLPQRRLQGNPSKSNC